MLPIKTKWLSLLQNSHTSRSVCVCVTYLYTEHTYTHTYSHTNMVLACVVILFRLQAEIACDTHNMQLPVNGRNKQAN